MCRKERRKVPKEIPSHLYCAKLSKLLGFREHRFSGMSRRAGLNKPARGAQLRSPQWGCDHGGNHQGQIINERYLSTTDATSPTKHRCF